MPAPKDFLSDFHWLMDVLQNIDVGLIILDEEFNIQLWNSFMQNHSAMGPADVLGKNIFESFPELPEPWFRQKVQSVFVLHNSAFTTWEQRPYLFKFKNYRPVTGIADFMYQNSTIIPLKDTRGKVEHICLIVYDVTEVAVNRLQIQAANLQLHEISRTDGLTGLLNRKTWELDAEQEYKRFKRHEHPCSLVMFDIDHFKNINDSYGHPAGDEVIRQTAAAVKSCIRDIDIAGRYGGEEFTIVLSDTDTEGALVVAERIRNQIQELTVHYEDFAIQFTVSLGVAQLTQQMNNRTAWIDCADKALYQAKKNGRNNSVVYTP
ncbi:GGDEF domain-containing protein [Saccharophagus degradans]|uniref:sensor domain-containing diguanylate cyclase n=1 Tax=Saccharophagus degradans TaxID=86304 RepID=UPI001C08DB90|nr:sensor domain-containing diguanylate cyclase [Saccharophagus degradans]MBU2984571.1 GGDEF domain-containing protein [Saccharophagus degradans]